MKCKTISLLEGKVLEGEVVETELEGKVTDEDKARKGKCRWVVRELAFKEGIKGVLSKEQVKKYCKEE